MLGVLDDGERYSGVYEQRVTRQHVVHQLGPHVMTIAGVVDAARDAAVQ